MNWADMTAFALTVPALYLMGKKNKNCFILFTVVNFLIVYLALSGNEKMPGLVMMSVVYTFFNIRNYILWKRQERDQAGI